MSSTALAQPPSTGAKTTVDTLSLKLEDAENMFLKNNLLLLSQKYNIDVQKALVIQAKLYPNPNISIYNGPILPIHDAQGRFDSVGFLKKNDYGINVSQLIILAGKRNKSIKVAEANAKLAEYQFYDLLRTLKYTLRSDFFNIYYLQQSAKVYAKEISALQQIVAAFNQQKDKGYIAEKEVVRIQAQLYSLQSEYNDLINQINDTESELRLILQIKPIYINPIPNLDAIEKLNPLQYPLATLIDTAYKNRTDLQIAKQTTDISKLNYNYQKALAVPDLTAGLSYQKYGGYVESFQSANLAIDLPFFSRNQGNIKSAKSTINMNAASQKSIEASVEEQVFRAVQKSIDNQKMYKTIDAKFPKDFERLLNEVLINYQKRNIGLLDFLDFYDSYKQNTLQLNNIQYNRVQAFEDINFYTGATMY
ncbi:MAG: TolC family protein [Bacteroidetes bacterium]|nr:TolC family protein [Bacteroidota bacterium]MBS1649568.1 TolC family protein [Bacteroidota bacterium]